LQRPFDDGIGVVDGDGGGGGGGGGGEVKIY